MPHRLGTHTTAHNIPMVGHTSYLRESKDIKVYLLSCYLNALQLGLYGPLVIHNTESEVHGLDYDEERVLMLSD
jgi:hypothetical protein